MQAIKCNSVWHAWRCEQRGGFFKGSGLVLEGLLVGFLDQKRMPKANIWFLWKANKTLRGRMKFEVRVLQQATKNQQKSMKNRMFFETSIWEAFWMDFGKVLGGQNLWFSQFFDVFSKSFLKHTREEQKNRFKRPENAEGANLVTGFRSSQPSWGEKKRGV